MWWWGFVPSIARGFDRLSGAYRGHKEAQLEEKLSKMTVEEHRAFLQEIEAEERERVRGARTLTAFVLLVPIASITLLLLLRASQRAHEQQSANQREQELASSKPLQVNPTYLAGTWYGRGGSNNKLTFTLTITSDERPNPPPNSGDSERDAIRNYLSTDAMVAGLGVTGAPSACAYENIQLYGSVKNGSILLFGKRSNCIGDSQMTGCPDPDTDRFQLSTKLVETGMSGSLSTTSIRPGCPAIEVPIYLSLIRMTQPPPPPVPPPAPKPFEPSNVLSNCSRSGDANEIEVALDGADPDRITLLDCSSDTNVWIEVRQTELSRVCLVKVADAPGFQSLDHEGTKAVVTIEDHGGNHNPYELKTTVEITQKGGVVIASNTDGKNYPVACDRLVE
jgi:hypothetical protein